MPTAYVLIKVDVGSEQKLLEDLNALSNVNSAHLVMGEYDLVATISCETMLELKDCINNKVRYLDNVISTMTLVVV